jgi:hypothetical protein
MKTNVLMAPALAFLALAVLGGCPMDPAADPSRQEQIEIRWAELEPSSTGSYYLAADPPSLTDPYHAGTLEPAYLADCLNMANFARFLAYLPDDLVMDAVMNNQSQHGALLLYADGTFVRDPPKPDGMSDEDYTFGLAGLDFGLLGSGYSSVAQAERQGWLPDTPFAPINLGHRRQILNPALQKVGFGHVDGYSVMQSLDASRAGSVDFEYVAWPSREAFPVEFFPAGTAWCVSLNPDLYNPPTVDDVTITLTRVSTSQTWTLDAGDTTYAPTDEYFQIDSASWGIANCIIFRPDSTAVYAAGETYEVQIADLSPKAGGVTTVSYEVRFFSLP